MKRSSSDLWYHPLTGDLHWKISGHGVTKGDVAGSIKSDGYRRVQIDGKIYLAHRLIWEMFNDFIPEGIQIDHINNIRDDNRIDNLRLVNNNKNQWNALISQNNTSGFKGVSFDSWSGLWRGRVEKNKIKYHKSFSTKELAVEWVRNKREELHEQYVNHG